MSGTPEVELHPALPCHRCGGELLFAVQVPVRTEWSEGQSVTGRRTATLCPQCDRDEPAAQGVLAFFTVHEQITRDTLDQATGVLREWIDHVTANPPTYTDDELDDDIRRWEAGEM